MKVRLLTILAISASLSVFAQEEEPPEAVPKILAPSPEVSSLMRFEEVPIDYYTGQPDISIPLFSKGLYGESSINVSLKYSSMGVRIDERSGWAGTGWALSAGGSISRTVRGIPDERNDPLARGVYHNPDFWDYNNLSSTDKEEFRWNTIGTTYDKYDSELDLYQFSYPGGSGRFVIAKSGGGFVPRVLSSDQKIVVDVNFADFVNYHIDSFVITDANGVKYTFSEFEFTSALSYSAYTSHIAGSVPGMSEPGVAGMSHFRSAWHLTDISLSNGVSIAKITYQTDGETYTSSESFTETEIYSGLPPAALSVDYNEGVLKPRRNVSYYDVSIGVKHPFEITFNDNTKVLFNYKPNTNHPETGGGVIGKITVKDNANSNVKTLDFDTEVINNRLWLNGVTENSPSGDAQPMTYGFTYRLRNQLPEFGSNSDPWGYHNESATNDEPTNPNHITTGLLTSVKFPTGGTKDFVWESNTFSHGAGADLTEEQLMVNPDNYTNLTEMMIFSGTYDLSNTQGVIHTESMAIDYDQEVTINVLQLDVAENPDVADEVIIKFEGPTTINVPLNGKPQLKADIPQGLYTVKVMIPLDLNTYNVDGDIRIHYREKNTPFKWFLYGGGVRIKEVLFKDGSETKRRFTYDYTDINDPTRSSGAVDGLLGSLARKYRASSNKMVKFDQGSSAVNEVLIWYDIFEKGSNAELTKGGYVGYQTVKVSEEGNGYILYHYDSPKQHPNSSLVFTFPFAPPANLDHLRGRLRKKEVFNELGNKLLEESTDYDEQVIQYSQSIKVVDVESCEQTQFYDTYQDYLNHNVTKNIPTPGYIGSDCGVEGSGYNAYVYDLEFARSFPVQKIVKDYPSGTNDVLFTKEKFTYNNANYQLSSNTKYVLEGGDTIKYRTSIYYPIGGFSSEYSMEPEESNMVTINKVNTPLLITKDRITASLNSERISTVRNIYHMPNNDNLYEIREVQVAYGDGPLESRVEYHKYDTYGNVQQLSKTNDMSSVYLWGHGSTVPVAEIKNANFNDVAAIVNVTTISNMGTQRSVLESEFSTLRASSTFDDSEITTLYYHPGRGVIRIVGPNGDDTEYEYDDFGRLLRILDKDDNILQKYTYNYASEE